MQKKKKLRINAQNLTVDGVTLTIAEWAGGPSGLEGCRMRGAPSPVRANYERIRRRIRTGWCPRCAVYNEKSDSCKSIDMSRVHAGENWDSWKTAERQRRRKKAGWCQQCVVLPHGAEPCKHGSARLQSENKAWHKRRAREKRDREAEAGRLTLLKQRAK